MSSLNSADYFIIGIIAVSMIISLMRGFIREALSLATWIIAIWVGIKYCGILGEYLKPYLTAIPVRLGVSFFIIFLVVLIIGAIISHIIASLAHKTGLSGTDRVLGLVFGVLRGVLVIAVLLLMASISGEPKDEWWKSSKFIPHFQPITVWLKDLLPENLKPGKAESRQLPNSSSSSTSPTSDSNMSIEPVTKPKENPMPNTEGTVGGTAY